jgi:hypothetical protein
MEELKIEKENPSGPLRSETRMASGYDLKAGLSNNFQEDLLT